MSVAAIRMRLEMEDVGLLSAIFAALYKVSVTVFLQSTHVPKTSKKSAFGCVLGAIVGLEMNEKEER